MNALQVFSYNGSDVSMTRSENGTVYVNLTEVAKQFPNKNLTQIINSQEIKEYCNSLLKLQNYSFIDLVIVSKGAPEKGGGTWAHQKVALRVAQKLSPDFAVWVDSKIEELLTTGVTTISNDDEAIAYAMNVLQKRLESVKAEKRLLEHQNAQKDETIALQSAELKEAAPKVEYYDEALSANGTYTTMQIAKEFGIGAVTLNQKLRNMGVQYKQNGQWLLYAKYTGKGYTKSITRTYTRSDGSAGSQLQTVWTEKGREFIHSLFHEKAAV